MTNAELTSLADIGRRRTVPKGQVIVWEGDRASICANLVSGVLKLTSGTEDGREQIVGLLYPGDFVGELFVDEAQVTVTALSDADLCFYARDRFEQVLDRHAALERLLLKRTMDSLKEARARLLVLGRRTAEEKVAGFLIEMSDRLAENGKPARAFDLPLARGEIADVLGLTIETVSRQFTRMKSDGLIALPHGRRVEVEDRERLAECVGGN
jgi:CRP/FNR family transcriptional regulator, anaerobic regulatory protein